MGKPPTDSASDEIRNIARAVVREQLQAEREASKPDPRRYRSVVLGFVSDGRVLRYDEAGRVFLLDGQLCELAEVRALDAAGNVRWRFLEQRDWMRRLDEGASAAAFERERARLGSVGVAGELDEQIRRHVRKDDSYLHGHLVDTNQEEAVARAIAEAMTAQGEEDPSSDKEPRRNEIGAKQLDLNK